MSTVRGGFLCAVMAGSYLACAAQKPTIPFQQIERNAQLSARTEVLPSVALVGRPAESASAMPAASESVLAPTAYKPPRTLSTGFFLMNGLHLGLAMLDVGLTQHCIADGHCREGNPIMPSSLAGQVAVDSAWVGWGTLISYKLKRNESRAWWVTPAIGIAAHTAGAASGFVNR